MFFIRLFVCTLITLLSCSAHSEESKPRITDHPEVKGALAVLEAWIDGVRDYQKIPGISVGFVVDQDLIFSKGYGYANVKRKVPADADTIYSVCSISKLFTSIGVMQMRDAGKLTLRDPVSEHLDWFNIKQNHEQAGPARIEGLLTHSSGLPRESDFPYWVDEKFPFPTREQMIDKLTNQETLYPADALFQYSNLALSLAGEIVQYHAGIEYSDYVQEAILKPLEMSDTRSHFPKKLHGKQMAVGYSGMGRAGEREPVPPFETKGITPAAGFTSTVNDLAKFASCNFRTLDGRETNILAPNTLREMQRVHWVNPDWKTTWGLGFAVREAEGQTFVGHGGGCPGYITSFSMLPKHKIAAIALTNASDGPAGNIAVEMMKVLGSALQKLTQPSSSNEPAIDLSLYEGNYGGTVWGGETAIRQWGNQLAMIPLPSRTLGEIEKLKHVEGHTFVRITNEGEEREQMVFQTDKKGNIIGLLRHSNISRRISE